ncbi:hypothetical protein lerEdw1_018400 [Lerista edwardsae]|nr:hypothetical protein lerEdw1_018400 [Lerista edwardsae]
MDSKPLLHDRPPAYSPSGPQGGRRRRGLRVRGHPASPARLPAPAALHVPHRSGLSLRGPAKRTSPQLSQHLVHNNPTTCVHDFGGCRRWLPCLQSWCAGGHLYLSGGLVCHRLFPYRNSFLPGLAATKMS